MELPLLLVAWIIGWLMALRLGDEKGRGWVGMVAGLVFGPLGVLIAATVQPTARAAAERQRAIEAWRTELERRQPTAPLPRPTTFRDWLRP